MKWPKVRLEDCTRIISGGTPRTSVTDYWDGDIWWATPKDLSDLDGIYLDKTPRTITRSGLDNCAAEILPVGSVLFSSRAPIGHVAINRVPIATNQGFKSFVPDSGVLDANYLLRWLKANRTYLEGLGNGATFKELSKAAVGRVEIPLPPLIQQRRIAAILNLADDLRRMRRTALELLSRFDTALFAQMFDNPLVGESRFPIRQLGDICSIIRDGTHKTPTYVASGIPFVTVKNIVGGELDLSVVKYVSLDEHRELTRRVKPKRGDVLVSKDGTIGVPCPVRTDDEFSIFVSVALIRPDEQKLNQMFLVAQLKTEWLQKQIRENSKGIAIRHLHLEDFRRLNVLVPPLSK